MKRIKKNDVGLIFNYRKNSWDLVFKCLHHKSKISKNSYIFFVLAKLTGVEA